MKKNTYFPAFFEPSIINEVGEPHTQFAKVELVREILEIERPLFTNPTQTYNNLVSIFSHHIETREKFIAVFLDSSNRPNSYYEVSNGGMTFAPVDIRLLFAAALMNNASQIIIAHNHPSGQTKPSESDIKLTERIKKAGELLDIKLLDHLIITKHDYLSFNEEGLL